jgi:ABC-type spermidine/putrescine transport system permease subunit II
VFRRIVLPLIRPESSRHGCLPSASRSTNSCAPCSLTGFERTLPVQFWYMIVASLSPEAPAMAVVIIVISVVTSLAGALISRRATLNIAARPRDSRA